MEGSGIPPPSKRMSSTGNHVLENSLPKINAKNFFIDFFIVIEMSQQMNLQAALDLIKKLQDEIKELKDEINQLKLQLQDDEEEYDDVEDEDEIYPEADSEEDAEWYDLKGFENDYEICNWYPYQIRRKNNKGKIVSESVNKQNGYINVALNGKPYQKHILVAKQFIPNPNHLPIVDHINHNKTDYRVSNLRWVSVSDNARNKSSTRGVVYEYVDTIPDEAIKVDTYGNHTFDNYYFFNNVFYFYTGINYRKLHINEDKYGYKNVCLINEDGKNVRIYYGKFKKLYDIPIE